MKVVPGYLPLLIKPSVELLLETEEYRTEGSEPILVLVVNGDENGNSSTLEDEGCRYPPAEKYPSVEP